MWKFFPVLASKLHHLAPRKSHIQGAGRARRSDAKIFYFDNDPDKAEGFRYPGIVGLYGVSFKSPE